MREGTISDSRKELLTVLADTLGVPVMEDVGVARALQYLLLLLRLLISPNTACTTPPLLLPCHVHYLRL
jgi:hypothetical protein